MSKKHINTSRHPRTGVKQKPSRSNETAADPTEGANNAAGDDGGHMGQVQTVPVNQPIQFSLFERN